MWQGGPLGKFVREVEERVRRVPEAPAPTGITMDIFHSTEYIRKSFYRAALYAFLLIVILVWIDLRKFSQTVIAISVLALGLPMLVILMGLLGESWNFANFFGLPILIGAGHEYGVFMVHRYREVLHNPRRAWRWWDVSDRAAIAAVWLSDEHELWLFLVRGAS